MRETTELLSDLLARLKTEKALASSELYTARKLKRRWRDLAALVEMLEEDEAQLQELKRRNETRDFRPATTVEVRKEPVVAPREFEESLGDA